MPKFAEKHPKTCDLISVDGGHQYEVAIEDLKNTRRLAAEQNFLLMDDTRCSSSYCEEPTKAWVEAIKKGWVEEMGCWTDAKGLRGWCLGRFV